MQAVWCNPSLSQRSQINQGKTLFTPSLLAQIFTVAAQLKAAKPPPSLPSLSGFHWKGVPKFIGCRMQPRGHGADAGQAAAPPIRRRRRPPARPPSQPAAACSLKCRYVVVLLARYSKSGT